MTTTKPYDAIVIGAGHNGLVCAFYLAQKGLRTCVIEKSDGVGGAAITEEFHPGFKNSVASYTVSLLQPKVIKDMALEQHGLSVVLRKIDNFLPNPTGYTLSGRNGLTAREIARHSVRDAQRYEDYSSALEGVVDCLREFLLVSPPNAGGGLQDVLSMLRSANIARKLSLTTQRNLLAFFTKSAGEILDHYFEDERVKALFGFDAVVGNFASPYEPGSAYVLLHHVFGEAAGVREAWGHAIGGMGSITQAMQRACQAVGVDIKVNQPVKRVVIENGRAVGVEIERAGGNPEVLMASLVASSVHPKILFEHLLEPEHLDPDFKERIQQYQSHSATFRMNVALKGLPKFTHAPSTGKAAEDYLTSGIIMAPSLAYMHQAWLDANQYGWSSKPIIEMLIPSTLDDTLAPQGQHVASLFCQQFKFNLPNGRSWTEEREAAADHIIATVDSYAPGFKELVIGRQLLSPLDLETKLSLIGGDIFHGRMSLDQLFSARPVLGNAAYRAPLKNLYLCGSGTHPGGGVTGAPGHNAAKQILRDWRWRWLGY